MFKVMTIVSKKVLAILFRFLDLEYSYILKIAQIIQNTGYLSLTTIEKSNRVNNILNKPLAVQNVTKTCSKTWFSSHT